MERSVSSARAVDRKFAFYGWVGLGLTLIFWALNWSLEGLRTHWGFFPMWLGYCLVIDALVLYRTGTSLLFRSWQKYIGLFLVSAPAWWLFEAINVRTQNWIYTSTEQFTRLEYAFWASINFSTVIPAIFGTAELIRSYSFIQKMGRGPIIRPTLGITRLFFVTGLVMFILMMVSPIFFYPFVWLSVYFMIEPVNVWMGNRSLANWTKIGDWRPIVSLWLGALICGFFWEMWNYFSYPKWIYQVPFVQVGHIFEMPILGYGGYMPFALELFALYHLLMGLLGKKKGAYVRLNEESG